MAIGAVAFAGMLICGHGQSIASEKVQPPNIVFIYADDLGYTDTGCYGSRYYETPHIDALAKGGMMFTAAYSNSPNCAPSRGALYSGQYCGRTGMYCVGSSERGVDESRSLRCPKNTTSLPSGVITFAQAMTSRGYNCVQLGKWHLGYKKAYLPPERGFKAKWNTGRFSGSYMSEIIYKPHHWTHFHSPPDEGNPFRIIFGDASDGRNTRGYTVTDESLIQTGTYLSDYLTTQAQKTIKDLKGDGRPFLLMLNHYLVHGPLNAPEDDVARFRGKKGEGDDNNPVLAAMTKKLDDSVGSMMKFLQDEDLLDNTLVIFYSDNGGVGGYKRLGIDSAEQFCDNRPLKGGKTMLYEGGIRVPFIAYWQGQIPPGSICDEPVAGIDFFPTFLDLAGASKEHFQKSANQTLDGLSLLPLFRKEKETLDRSYIAFHFPAYALGHFGNGPLPRAFWRSTPMGALRGRRYKLVEHFVGENTPGDGSRIELYDLINDIGETKDISREKPEVAEAMHEELVAWRKATGARMPSRKAEDLKSYNDHQDYTIKESENTIEQSQ